MATKFDDIKKQAQFCTVLMTRLNDDIQEENDISAWDFSKMRNKSQKQMDVIRLRRELNKLNMMLN